MPVDPNSQAKALTQAEEKGDIKMAETIRAQMICSAEKPDSAQ